MLTHKEHLMKTKLAEIAAADKPHAASIVRGCWLLASVGKAIRMGADAEAVRAEAKGSADYAAFADFMLSVNQELARTAIRAVN